MGAEQPDRIKDTTGNGEVEAQCLQEHARNNRLVPPSDGACPINRLPPEILSLIFEHGTAAAEDLEDVDEEGYMTWNEFSERHAEDEEGSGEQKGRIQEEEGEQHESGVGGEEGSDSDDKSSECESDTGGLPFQLIISQVCRHWRTVALETPSLWTRIKVSCMDRPPYERVNAFLDRSKSLPLEIYVDSESPDDLSDDEDPPAELSNADLEKLFTLLVPHVPRWGSIDVHVTSYEDMYTFLKMLSDPSVPPASQLQVLRLYHHEEFDGHLTSFPEPDFSDHFTIFNGSAPRLQNVSLWGVHVDWTQSWLHSPNLVELELAYHTPDVRPDWPTFSAMLRAAAPTLEKLCLESSGPSGSPHEWIVEPDTPEWNVDANSPILLPKLIQLELAFIPPLEVISLLRKLCMPSLKVLALNFDDGDYTDLVTYLARPTTTAATKAIGATSTIEQPRSLLGGLESLKIAGLRCSEQSVERMYNELVNLEALNLSMHHLPSPFFGILHPQPTPTLEGSGPPDTTVSYRVPLPRLATLFVSDVRGGLVRRFVHERQWVGAPLRMVFVEEDTYVTSEDESWLKENLEKFDYFEGSDDEDGYEESLPSDYMSYEEWDADDDWLESGSE
ncbi:hypothetical protein EDD15DRAFT_2370199 [Pisolithus albus]|nr:hypothetical protein EDD15DRAFT_2370199 [Pisolithus albus]